jgi:diadenosine tetraphosphate (Ap4A) HIT family hydrolase
MITVKKIASKLESYLQPIGFNYGINEGSHAGQRIDHLHFHILPRFEGDKHHLPAHHLFHRDLSVVRDLTPEEITPFVNEFKNVLASE